MSTLAAALSNLRRDNPPLQPCPSTFGCEPGCCTGDRTNVAISREVADRIVSRLGTEWCDFGTFDNCREYGLTFTASGWQFAVFEHRNSDHIMLEGCPLAEVKEWGPYGGIDKWHMIAHVGCEDYDGAADMLEAALRYVHGVAGATRASVIAHVTTAVLAGGES